MTSTAKATALDSGLRRNDSNGNNHCHGSTVTPET
jgi:hypothetical protein